MYKEIVKALSRVLSIILKLNPEVFSLHCNPCL